MERSKTGDRRCASEKRKGPASRNPRSPWTVFASGLETECHLSRVTRWMKRLSPTRRRTRYTPAAARCPASVNRPNDDVLPTWIGPFASSLLTRRPRTSKTSCSDRRPIRIDFQGRRRVIGLGRAGAIHKPRVRPRSASSVAPERDGGALAEEEGPEMVRPPDRIRAFYGDRRPQEARDVPGASGARPGRSPR